jgi:hypothetical protein
MEPNIHADDGIVAGYFDLFVNRLAYTVQSSKPDSETGRCYYYRPKGRVSLSRETVKSHLEGRLTIGLYAINPATQRCKWVAIDADYSSALDDLLKLQWELRQDGVEAALEKSRRGGHLWIFAEKPLLARECRLYIHSLAKRLRVPVKTTGLADGIEVFPKQNEVPENEFGNAIRGPLGVHRGAGKRFWFYGADYRLAAQFAYLERIKRITGDEMSRFVVGLDVPEDPVSTARQIVRPYAPSRNLNHREFRILDHVSVRRRAGRNYWTRCPSCAEQSRDRTGDNLAISVADPRKYRCWAGCSKEQIRAALGCPIRHRHGLSA